MPRSKTILAIGVLAYLIAWFVPVIEGGTTLAQGGLPGWEAFRFALHPLIPYGEFGDFKADSSWAEVLSVLSALTNLLFVGATFILLQGKAAVARFLTLALFSAATLDTWWFVLSVDRGGLRTGYYLWVLSFFLAATASTVRSKARGQASGPPRS